MKLLLLLAGFFKLGKFLTTGGTMLVSVVAYSFIFGWPYAVGFIGLIFLHEMGHYLAAKAKGLPVGLPVFIPFVGAWIEMKEMPRNAEVEAYVGLAGPLVGTIGALLCYYVGREFNYPLLLALAYAGFFINLFNLIPLPPFDGGRVTAVLSPKIWLLGLPILVAIFLYRPSPILILMGVLAVPHVWKSLRNNEEDGDYYQADAETRLTYALFYIGLIIFLALMMDGVYQMIPRH